MVLGFFGKLVYISGFPDSRILPAVSTIAMKFSNRIGGLISLDVLKP
jgi:hypothetical protein